MKKKTLLTTIILFSMAAPVFAQPNNPSAISWIFVAECVLIGICLISLPMILRRTVLGIREPRPQRLLTITLMVFIGSTSLTYLTDAVRYWSYADLTAVVLRMIGAVTLLTFVITLIRSRGRVLQSDESKGLEKLVSERTSALSELNQRLQLEIESRKQAEKEVSKREKRFRALIENISDGIVLNDENTIVLYQSPSVTRILGYTFEERQQKPVLNYVHEDDKPSFLKLYDELASQPGKPLHFQFRFRHKNGHYIWLEGVVTNLLHDRNVNGYVANYRDISERKAAEESLRQERYLLRTLIDNIPDYIYIKDTSLRHIVNNKANVQLIGAATEAETIGKTVMDYFDKEIAEQFMEADRKVLSSGKPVLDVEEKIVGHNNEIRWLLTSKIPLIEQNDVVGLIGISRDITEQKNAETVLKELNNSLAHQASKLAASNAELERFAYVASHDLQEPLRMVRSFLQLLKKKCADQFDEESHQYVDFAVEGAERMKQLITDLLEYSRVGVVQERLDTVDMNETVLRTLETLRDIIGITGATIKVGELPAVLGVRAQLGQVMQNLLSNAIKYRGQAAPEIVIGGVEEPTHWKFYVSDNGMGIDPRFFDKIFVIFQRLHNESETKGTGIGLAICKKIVESHGGKIWVESTPEVGSTFHFTISKRTQPYSKNSSAVS